MAGQEAAVDPEDSILCSKYNVPVFKVQVIRAYVAFMRHSKDTEIQSRREGFDRGRRWQLDVVYPFPRALLYAEVYSSRVLQESTPLRPVRLYAWRRMNATYSGNA